MTRFKMTAAAVAIVLAAPAAFAETWTLDGEMSKISFGSIKNEYNGEVHHFGGLSGTVDGQGLVSITVPLASVETMIDIRNERMREIVFNNSPTATLSATVDMAALGGLDIGEGMVTEADGTLTFLGKEVDLFTNLFVMRVGEGKVLVTTDGMLMVATDELGIDAPIDMLQEIAGLDGITRVSPVTLRLVFDSDAPDS
jgi:polyisoprenoid-binding protein YceI